ncbi:MAG: UbiA family prenyltransferase [Candidatus Limnocylindrales bacterium]
MLRLVHPFPSVLDAAVTAVFVLLAGGSSSSALLLGSAMLGLQFAIGALNDLVDQRDDAVAKPRKPLPAGLVSRRTAGTVVVLGAGCGLLISAAAGSAVLLVAVLGSGLGLAYDLRLKRTVWAWLPYALALPLIPAYAWLFATGSLPPRYPLLAVLGLLAGIALATANGLVDAGTDRSAGSRGIAVALGRTRSLVAIVSSEALLLAIAVLTLLAAPVVSAPALAAVAGAAGFFAVGVALSGAAGPAGTVRRELGWEIQAVGVGLLAAGWFAAQLV